ncbi:MAG: TetR/AcrR family transcriptional regulator C-terminal domain-containing protein [Clostridia bacterium]|nr:TetR/AcrR family transcriptional regulator C-terminal domain-containing protein [Clostridia bacterium]MBR6634921.1 TetR/AcrR family transcriptional regulator C-terminal domain-containing protein [Clostridia bacterium]
MADSNITKKALAAALKELMDEMPFAGITISDICDRCDMNRKSFYYHFKDKYDLVNWIFDTEFLQKAMVSVDYETKWDAWRSLFVYFYENKNFYRKALEISGQNSFTEHFQEILVPIIKKKLEDLMGSSAVTDFQIYFLTDAFFCALKRWLLDKNCVPPDEVLEQLKIFIYVSADSIVNEDTENQ